MKRLISLFFFLSLFSSGIVVYAQNNGRVSTKSDVSRGKSTMSEDDKMLGAFALTMLMGDLMAAELQSEAESAALHQTYTTKQGDTTWKLAKDILTDNNPQWRPSNTDIYVMVEKIAIANNLTDKENGQFKKLDNLIKTPGSVIIIPYPYTYSKANAPKASTSSASTSQTSNKTIVTQHANPSTPVSKPVSTPTTTQKPAVTPQKQTITPKPAVSSSQPAVVSKAMTLKQMITCLLGVLSVENPTIDSKTVENNLAAVDSNWEVWTNLVGQVHANHYDMTYEGHKPDAYCGFIYKNNSKPRLQNNYTFYFKKEKEAIAFRQSLVGQMKSEGATATKEGYENKNSVHVTKLTCYGLPVTVVQLKAPTKLKYQVRINVDY